jgi:uncharacterized membrane protein YedE/YeeE
MIMENFTPVSSLAGGLLIGVVACLMLLLLGRITGIAGIIGGALKPTFGDLQWRLMFIIGMMMGPLIYSIASGRAVAIQSSASEKLLLFSGLLVGFGTRLGSGCTSGHGVCGLGRRSVRSLVSTLIFMLTAAGTVFVTRHVAGAGGAP